MNRLGYDYLSVSVNDFESDFSNWTGDGMLLDDFIGDEDIWRGKSYEAPRYYEAKSVKRAIEEKGEGRYALAA